MSEPLPPNNRLSNIAIQLALALLLSVLAGMTATLQSHIGRIAVVEQKAGALEHQYERIENKLDRLLRDQ